MTEDANPQRSALLLLGKIALGVALLLAAGFVWLGMKDAPATMRPVERAIPSAAFGGGTR